MDKLLLINLNHLQMDIPHQRIKIKFPEFQIILDHPNIFLLNKFKKPQS